MIKTVVREHHFTPSEIDAFFLDEKDYHGLIFWYEDIRQVHEELNNIKNKKNK